MEMFTPLLVVIPEGNLRFYCASSRNAWTTTLPWVCSTSGPSIPPAAAPTGFVHPQARELTLPATPIRISLGEHFAELDEAEQTR